MELKEKELKLLAYLYHHNRESLTEIARAMQMTRIQVEYALNKFLNEGIIESFFTMFDYSAFGYKVYALAFIKLEKFSSLQKFTKRLEASKHCISCGECFGKYDIFANLIFKSEEEMSNFLSETISKQNEQVLDYVIIKPYLAEFHPLKILHEKKQQIFPLLSSNPKEKKFSESELKIMKLLSQDGRAKLIDIAKKVNISAEMVLHKIKKLQKEKVILGIRTQVKMKKLGYSYSMILLNVKNLSHDLKQKITEHARKEKRANSLVLSLFNPNCIIQIFHKTEDELKEEIKKIKELLKDEIFDLDVVLAQEEDKINTLPFL
jgi:Lrp/AsnC family transcriptional regulator, leucine-responsive regulatory protein